MNDCRQIAERLAAYADESLPADERAGVQRHLDECTPCRTVASHEREAHALIRARAQRLHGEPLPPGLRSRCEALAQSAAGAGPAIWRARLIPATLGAVLLVITGAAILPLATHRSDALLAAQLAADHIRCFRTIAPDAPALDAAQVEAALAERYGWDIHVPPSSLAAQVQLVQARRCLYAGGRMPHLLYRVNGAELSLFMIGGARRRDTEVTSFGHRSHVWTRSGTTFVLVTPAAGGHLDRAVQYVMHQAR